MLAINRWRTFSHLQLAFYSGQGDDGCRDYTRNTERGGNTSLMGHQFSAGHREHSRRTAERWKSGTGGLGYRQTHVTSVQQNSGDFIGTKLDGVNYGRARRCPQSSAAITPNNPNTCPILPPYAQPHTRPSNTECSGTLQSASYVPQTER